MHKKEVVGNPGFSCERANRGRQFHLHVSMLGSGGHLVNKRASTRTSNFIHEKRNKKGRTTAFLTSKIGTAPPKIETVGVYASSVTRGQMLKNVVCIQAYSLYRF